MTYTPDAITDISHLATKIDLAQKANASTVGGLSTAVKSKAAQADLEALAAMVAEFAPQTPDAPE